MSKPIRFKVTLYPGGANVGFPFIDGARFEITENDEGELRIHHLGQGRAQRDTHITCELRIGTLEVELEARTMSEHTTKRCSWCNAVEGACDCDERTACPKAGQIGHFSCGVCEECGLPRFACLAPTLHNKAFSKP